MTKKLFTLTTLFTLMSCGSFEEKITEQIDEATKEAIKFLETEDKKSKVNFYNAYENALKKTTDTTRLNIQNLFATLMRSTMLIDSLKAELNKLSSKNPDADTKLVRQIFFNNGSGDSLFNSLRHTFTLAQNVALTDTSKLAVKKIADNSLSVASNFKDWKEQFFGFNSSGGSVALLYGFESELLLAGTKSLIDYK